MGSRSRASDASCSLVGEELALVDVLPEEVGGREREGREPTAMTTMMRMAMNAGDAVRIYWGPLTSLLPPKKGRIHRWCL